MPQSDKRLFVSDAKFLREVDYLKKYLKHLQEGVQEHSRGMHTDLQDDISYFGIQVEADLIDAYQDDIIKIPSYYYNSAFLLIYALLETTMKDICNDLHRELNLPIKPSDIKGQNYFTSSLKYISCFTPITQELLNNANTFQQYQQIRNDIVHNGSSTAITSNSKEQRLFAKFITYDKDGSFRINDPEFLRSFLSKVSNFMIKAISFFNSLEVTPVATNTKCAVKYYTQKEFNRLFSAPLDKDSDELPF